jgi:uncharacterized protein (DUF1810 family)
LLYVSHLQTTLEVGYDRIPPLNAYAPASGGVVDDQYDLQRFVDAQATTYADAIEELRRGDKRSHWMWFVFPQVAGLGQSPTARRYGISGLDEARAYLGHPVLGPRLVEAATALLELESSDAEAVLNSDIDAKKLRSSMTLFNEASEDQAVFGQVLQQYFRGEPDPRTLDLLS